MPACVYMYAVVHVCLGAGQNKYQDHFLKVKKCDFWPRDIKLDTASKGLWEEIAFVGPNNFPMSLQPY